MKMRLLAMLFAALMALSLTACGGNASDNGSAGQEDPAVGDTAETETDTEDTVIDEEETADGDAAESDTDKPADTNNDTSKPSDTTSKPSDTTKPSNKPSGGTSGNTSSNSGQTTNKPSGGTEQGSASVDLSAFYTSVTTTYPDFPATSQLDSDGLDAFYAGLSDISTEQSMVYTPMISAVACEIALVEVSSSSDVKKVSDIFQARIDYQIEQGAFYPATVEAWQNNAKIVTNGNCVMLIVFDNASDVADSFNALFK